MSFINERLPEDIAYGFSGGPRWSTTIVDHANGRENRNANWMYGRCEYTADINVFTAAQRKTLLNWVYAARGAWLAFRFKDWLDFEAVDEPLAPAIGTTTPVQLIKTYTVGATLATRLIRAPVAGTVTVYRDGGPVAGTLDDTTGLFTPDAAWVAGTYTWSGQHDVWVRFLRDYNPLTIHRPNGTAFSIDLIEVRR